MEILNGSYVVTFPPLLVDKSQKDEPVSLDTAITRLRNSEMPGQSKASIYIFPYSQLDAYGGTFAGPSWNAISRFERECNHIRY